MTQVLQGLGSSFAIMATALALSRTEIGTRVGGSLMYLPGLEQEECNLLFGDIMAACGHAMDDPVHRGVIGSEPFPAPLFLSILVPLGEAAD